MSELITKLDGHDEEISAYISPVPNETTMDIPQSLCKSSIHRRKDLLLEFLDVLCFPGSRIKILDISVDVSKMNYKAAYFCLISQT